MPDHCAVCGDPDEVTALHVHVFDEDDRDVLVLACDDCAAIHDLTRTHHPQPEGAHTDE